jgi:hypothetical protein
MTPPGVAERAEAVADLPLGVRQALVEQIEVGAGGHRRDPRTRS